MEVARRGRCIGSGHRDRTLTVARVLASAVNGAADVMTNPFVQRMGQYIADVHIAGNAYVNYGDAHMEDAPTPELVYRYGVAA